MKWIISRYNHDIIYLKDYTDDYVLYDRSPEPIKGSIVVPNIGSDIYDKFTYIIDNYDNLPDVFALIKGNLFKYITKEEFELVKDNKTFTPLLTKGHKTNMPVCYYDNGLYCEINNYWYLSELKSNGKFEELLNFLGCKNQSYLCFAPGSNYIVTKETIHKHSKEYYEILISFLDGEYPVEAQLIERNLYNIWK